MLASTPSSYYQARKRGLSEHDRLDARLCESSDETYGAPRVHADLKRQGFQVRLARVARLVRAMGCKALERKSAGKQRIRIQEDRASTTMSSVDSPLTSSTGFGWPMRRIFIRVKACFILRSSWIRHRAALSAGRWRGRQDANLMCRALKAAIARRSYRTGTVIHHSDRGSQYTSKEFSELCQAHDVTHWIEIWYNKQRLHMQLDFMSPEEFETRLWNARND